MVQRLANADLADIAARREVTIRTRDDGMVRIAAILRPEEAALVFAKICAADARAARSSRRSRNAA